MDAVALGQSWALALELPQTKTLVEELTQKNITLLAIELEKSSQKTQLGRLGIGLNTGALSGDWHSDDETVEGELAVYDA